LNATRPGPKAWLPLPRSRVAGHRNYRGGVGVDIGGERLGEELAVQVQVNHLATVGVGERHWPQRRRHQTVAEDLGLKELLNALALVGHPPSDEDQRLHLFVRDGSVETVSATGPPIDRAWFASGRLGPRDSVPRRSRRKVFFDDQANDPDRGYASIAVRTWSNMASSP